MGANISVTTLKDAVEIIQNLSTMKHMQETCAFFLDCILYTSTS